ncbi:MAG: putative alpha/beta hydrolase family esterase [Oleiphilaceae bacterium]|jgi:predicted alpha/beta hydrolase family esterase
MVNLSAIAVGELIEHDSIQLKKIRAGKGPLVITINGFLSENGKDQSDWSSLLYSIMPNSPWIHMNWPSGNFDKLIRQMINSSPDMLTSDSFKSKEQKLRQRIAKSFSITRAASEWVKAMDNAEKAGNTLGQALSECNDRGIVLIGHSLGVRVIHHALQSLKKERADACSGVLLLGGAVTHDTDTWTPIFEKFKSLQVCNCYSHNDLVLSHLYQIGTLFTNHPCGLKRMESSVSTNLYNFNMSEDVSGHTAYKKLLVGQAIAEKFNKIEKLRNLSQQLIHTANLSHQARKDLEKSQSEFDAQHKVTTGAMDNMKSAIDLL